MFEEVEEVIVEEVEFWFDESLFGDFEVELDV